MKTNTQEFKDLIAEDSKSAGKEVPKEVDEELQVPEVILEAMDQTLTVLAPTTLEKKILENSLQGISVAQTSYLLGVPESSIRTYLRKPQVKEYMKEIKEVVNEIDQMMITGTLRNILGDRVKEIQPDENGNITYSGLTRKDTLDVIKVFSDITNQIAKGSKEEVGDNVFTNIYQQIIGK